MKSFKQLLNQVVSDSLARVSGIDAPDAHVITASRPEFGDYQANGVMALAKQLKTNPRQIAQAVVEDLQAQELAWIDKLEVAGPGFINVHLNNQDLLERGATALAEVKSLLPEPAQKQRIVVDYSSPNLAKEMHVGHLRGTIIGDCLVRVLESCGHNIIRQNHVGDWGTQFGMLITYMQEVSQGQSDIPNKLADLESFYRDAKERFDNDADFATRARQAVVKLQGGDADHLQAWEQFIDESLRHCEAVYEKLGVTLKRDDLDAESRYNDKLAGIIEQLREKQLLTEDEGAQCVFLPQFVGKEGEPLPVIVQKSDGGYLYSTTDLAAIQLRAGELKADRSLYVVDARQSLHFQQVFAVARAAGMADEKLSLEHIAYGTMMGSDGRPFKTRSGDTVKLSELLDEAVRRAFDLVSEKNPELEETERQTIADRVGIAAVKYADLSKNRTSDYVFDWSTMLSFDGNTAPYMLYAYARIKSILRKQDSDPSVDQNKGAMRLSSIDAPEERMLLMKILQMPEIVQMVADDCYPNQLCNYLFELAGIFMRFYESCPILKAEAPLRESRLALASLTAETLKQGLSLLGIEPLERM
ncbi:MAG: arginine--tRNA ligase [Pseudomonadales bacterium]|nr:arginine--tRNA ligase [Pseudomonadales bacterium]